MSFIYFSKSTGAVKMIADNKLETADNFDFIKKTLTADEELKFKKSFHYHIKVKDGKLDFEKKPDVEKREKLKEEIENASSPEDFKNLFRKFVK